MKVLVTGGAGFIGSHLIDKLLLDGYEITTIDNESSGSLNNLSESLKHINFVSGDIRDEELIASLMKKSDRVFHMAAALGVHTILNSTVESISTNFYGSEVVLKAASKFSVPIVIASTSEIYGKNTKQPLAEEDDRVIGAPQKLRWSYSDAKALEESLASALHLNENLPVTTIRYFNTVGPRQSAHYGMVLPRLVQNALEGKALPVHGDGTQTRVFCHVNDAVLATVKLAQTVSSIGEVFNVGGLEEISITELAKLIIKLTNSTSQIEFLPYSQAYGYGFEDMQRRVPDISKVKSHVQWQPLVNLNQIILDVAKHLAQN
jgi:UDP-glucose 4-epimerase